MMALTLEERKRMAELKSRLSPAVPQDMPPAAPQGMPPAAPQAATGGLTLQEKRRLGELRGKEQYETYAAVSLTPQEKRRLAELRGKEQYKAYTAVTDTISGWANEGVQQFKKIGQIYETERKSGRQAVKEAYEKPGLGSAVRGLGGAIQYAASPLTALARGALGDPVEKLTGSRFAGDLATASFDVFPFGQALKARMLMNMAPGVRAAENIPGLMPKSLPGKPTVPKKKPPVSPEAGPELPPSLAKETKGKGRFFIKRVSDDVVKDITKASDEALRGNWDGSQRIFKEITDKLGMGEINVKYIPEILKKHNLTPLQFAKEYQKTVSSAGRILGYHGQAARRLKKVFADEPEALAALNDMAKAESGVVSGVDRALDAWRNLENFRRGLLVTQAATALRNLWSQAGRISIGTIDTALQGVIRGTVGGQGDTLREVEAGLSGLTAAWRRLTPKGRRKLNAILDSEGAVLHKARFLSRSIHEVTLGSRLVAGLNVLNRAQEMMFRRLAFEAKLRELLKRKGLDFNTIDPNDVPLPFLEESLEYSFEMTFAASPKSKAAREVVNAWTRVPGLTTINPFPRFYGNSMKFIYEHSPLGYLKAASPRVLKGLASGDPDEFAKLASRATIGSLMLDSAWRIRQSKYAGEKWYEIKTEEDPETGESQVIDIRAYAPLTSYFMLAEAFINPKNLTSKDYIQMAAGLNRVAGTGLVISDFMRARSGRAREKVLKRFTGQYLGSFSVPARTAKDIYSAFDPEESIYRDIERNPVAGPFLQNIPKISQMFPEAISPYTTTRIGSEPKTLFGVPRGIARQLTGFSKTIKPAVRREIDKVGLDFIRVYPRTRVPEADRKIEEYMGPLVERYFPRLAKNSVYKNLSLSGKREALAYLFKEARREARKKLNIERPDLALQIITKRARPERKEIIRAFRRESLSQKD